MEPILDRKFKAPLVKIIKFDNFRKIRALGPGIILETEGSIRKIQKGHFFTIKKLKRAPLI